MRRKILITGGSSGIGLALANRLASRHDVMVTGSRKKGESAGLSPNVIYVEASQVQPDIAKKAIANALLRAGWVRLDNVILNAGIGYTAGESIDTIEKIRATMDVNVTATIILAQALYPWLSKANGSLLLIGSVAHKGQALFPAYAASKSALNGFARALRSEWHGDVCVQILHPGPTRTQMHEKAGYYPGKLRALFLTPETMAAMMEHTIAAKRSPVNLSWGKFLLGGSIMGRKL